MLWKVHFQVKGPLTIVQGSCNQNGGVKGGKRSRGVEKQPRAPRSQKQQLSNSLLPNHSIQSLSKACLHIKGDCKLSGLQDSLLEHSRGTNPENTADKDE
jgi:hypothetical protein